MIREYDPSLLTFIIDVHNDKLQKVKDELVEAVRHMESDEKAYLYHPNNNQIPRWPGAAVGMIANFFPSKIKWRKAFNHCIALSLEEDEDAARFFYIIIDHLDETFYHSFKRALSYSKQIDITGCGIFDFYILGLDCDLSEFSILDDKVFVQNLQIENLSEFIINSYKKQELSFGIVRPSLDFIKMNNDLQLSLLENLHVK